MKSVYALFLLTTFAVSVVAQGGFSFTGATLYNTAGRTRKNDVTKEMEFKSAKQVKEEE
jgi:hypothetical protein